MLLLDVLFVTLVMQRLGNQPNKLLSVTVSLLFYFILNIRLNKIPAQCTFIILVRTATLDSQPVTISVVLDSWCSEALHRTMLVWLLRDQSDMFYNLCCEPWSRKCINYCDSNV